MKARHIAHWSRSVLNLRLVAAVGLLAVGTIGLAGDKDTPPPPKAEVKDAPKTAPAPAGRSGIFPQTEKISALLAQAWKANNLRPSARATDFEFLRRACLDLIGRIATPAEVRYFERNPNRPRLIHRLLYEKVTLEGKEYDYPREFANHWANVWTAWLMTRTADATYREEMRVWLEEHFTRGGSHKEMVEQLLTASGDNQTNPATNYVLKHLGEPVPKDKAGEEGYFDMVPLTSRTTRLFLGLQTQCVQCHDHPFNPEWKQQAFWGVNVFFRQVKREPLMIPRRPNNIGEAPKLTLLDDDSRNRTSMIPYEKRSGVVLLTRATFLDGRKAEFAEGDARTRRQRLAELVVTSEQFPKAYVNRVWGHLFGRGMNEHPAVDDFGEHNKVLHPELLNYLASEFASETSSYDFNPSNGYDPKKLLYWVCSSDAYSLSSVANPTNEKPEAEPYFSRMLLKAMSPEQLYESLAKATGAERPSATEWRKKREEWLKKLVQNFGDDEGNEVNFSGTLLQALMMMNGKELSEAIKNPDKGTLAEALHKYKTPGRVMEELFLASLNRRPSGNEGGRLMKYRTNDAGYYIDVFWSLLNSNEFFLNH
jgi:hypothetical protein